MVHLQAARQSGGCVLVHCSQGVSRSVTLVVAYLMWKLGKGYYEVFETVKAVRGVASPNIGFSCQARIIAVPAAPDIVWLHRSLVTACVPAVCTRSTAVSILRQSAVATNSELQM